MTASIKIHRLSILCVTAMMAAASPSFAGDEKNKEAFIRPYDDYTFLVGVPLNEAISNETLSIKFNLGVRTRALCSPGGWDFFIAYRQLATWNAFGTSGPFKDILFRPGVYFRKESGHHLFLTGLEHLSNGRPFSGNKAACEGYDDGSRGMNYALFKWTYTNGGDVVSILAKAGVGCGVGSYERHCQLFTQDLFLNYLGYLSFDYSHLWERFGMHATVTPIWNKSIANVQVDTHWNFHPKWPGLYLEFHYRYDENMCGCSPDVNPVCYIRLGLKYSFGE